MKLTIYHGTVTPFVAVGKNQCNMLEFAFKYPSWHSYTNDKITLKALNGLLKRGCIIVNQYNQFKINMGF
jgi:hypothetical protein